MQFVPSINLIKKADKEGYAVPAFTVWNAETIKVVLETAEKMRSPVILLNGPSELMLFKPHIMAEIARVIAKDFTIPASLHLDHGNSLELVKECIDAKYTSVMLDFSSKPYEENVNALKKVVSLARPLGITVEGELGSIGRAEKYSVESGNRSGLTDPKEAKKYAKETGVDMLAVSIGNAHGIYTILPKFDFTRLKEIHELTNIPLVLHGGSGTPDEDVKQSIALGIRKINVASELVQAFREKLMNMWTNGEKLWMSIAFVEGLKVLPAILKKWIRNMGSEGKAD